MLAKFLYEDKPIMIQFNEEETTEQVCNRFITKVNQNIDNLNFKIKEKILKLDVSLVSQIDSLEDKKEIVILVTHKEKENQINIMFNVIKNKIIIQKGKAVVESKNKKKFNFIV